MSQFNKKRVVAELVALFILGPILVTCLLDVLEWIIKD
jgi:hypothetical protein